MLKAKSRRCSKRAPSFPWLPDGHNQIAIQTDLQVRAFFQFHLSTVEEQTATAPQTGSSHGSDRRAFAAAGCCSACRAHAGPDGSIGDHPLHIRPFAIELAFLAG